jgi:peptide/nickel transport system substrate-binding protein
VTDDGLTWTFTLRDDVKFHSGDPLTAQSFVWTWDRCRAEDFVCPVSEGILGPIASYEAKDDYTLVLNLNEPYYPMLESLTAASYLQPLNQRVVEEAGDQYGWTVAESVGAYMFDEWVQDEKIILKRNPDYTWGPELFEGANPGPLYIETIEWRFLPDYSTVLAGVEAGELGYASIEPKDLETVEATGLYHIYESVASHYCYAQPNMTLPQFQDLKVRQALNMAVDREAMLQVIRQGKAIILEGPLHEGFIGYDGDSMAGSGYPLDLEGAKALMEEAGYTYDADGMLVTPDGEPFVVQLLGTPEENDVKVMQMLVDMWGKLGITVEITQMEWGTMAPVVFGGEYEITTMCIGWPEADIMYMMYHSANIGGINFAYYEDAKMDELLMATRTETDPAARQEAVNEAYHYIVDNALLIPTLGTVAYQAVHTDFQGLEFSSYTGIVLTDAYYVGE